ncbi:MAG: HD family phosphohydrolase [Nitrospirae bacterium CG08_land_8_20_14_0_20_52_24]|nr:MAG: HD family phosphohydrolase [Nitrospirae bacterium CG08_land_8_20_14_0_20_52_24]PIW85718.1 MAG: HD family phosphohydrolase [Nitrospirae bacterium CG_4_8_14_3_um_filter_50_41]PIX86413.1 MAG: HD family phosphohydrolase [Nitrospirae bacterium CG_4_10_14_3_um_filter_53_41]
MILRRDFSMGILISEMREGKAVEGIYLVRSKSIGTTRAGKPFLTLKLQDRSGEMEAKVWEGAEKASKEFSNGDFVKTAGQVNEYNGKLQLTLQSVKRVEGAEINIRDFLPSSKRSLDEMLSELGDCIRKVKDPHLVKLLLMIFQDPVFKEKFSEAPAAKGMHHAYLGGLLEHTLSLFQLCECVAPRFPEVDLDLLFTGALLHDIGKVDELEYSRGFSYTDRGRLMGHIVLELEQVSEAIRSIPGFPDEKAILLKHLLISHHGKEEFGSPVKPMTLTALILHMMDDLDAKSQTFRGMIEGSQGDERWSAYHNRLQQFVFKGFPSEGGRRRREDDADSPVSRLSAPRTRQAGAGTGRNGSPSDSQSSDLPAPRARQAGKDEDQKTLF